MPDRIQEEFGFALYLAQEGEKADNAKPLTGFGGAGVLEVVESFEGDRIARFTRCGSRKPFTSYIAFRKSLIAVGAPRSKRSTSSESG